ncbi:MAG: hypothetical protein P8Y70_21190 [Candidatus Lokiarchaeota archaeon]
MAEIKDSIFLQVEKFDREPEDPFILTMHSSDSKQINTVIDDIIHLKGKAPTAGICALITYNEDDQGIIKLTSMLCQNAGVEPGDFVEVKKIKNPEKAEMVTLKPYNLNLDAKS